MQILNEVHSCICGHHASSQALVAKAFQTGFFWLTAHADAVQIALTCVGCRCMLSALIRQLSI